MGMTRTLTRRSKHHTPLAERIVREDRRSPQPVDALRVRMALARPVDGEFARRLRDAVEGRELANLRAEVTERLRAL